MKQARYALIPVAFFSCLGAIAGCAGDDAARTAGPAAATQASTPRKPNVLQEAADGTWKVIQAPARLIMPAKKVDAPASQPAPQPAEAVFVNPQQGSYSTSPMRIPLSPAEEPAATRKGQ